MNASVVSTPIRYNVYIHTRAGANRQPLELTDPNDFHVRGFTLTEGMHEPYSADIRLVTETLDLDVPGLAGGNIELMFNDRTTQPSAHSVVEPIARTVHGVVLSSHYLGTFDSKLHLQVTVGPALALLQFTQRSRIFQEKTILQIAEEVTSPVFVDRGRKLDTSKLANTYDQVRDYCVQFRESDLGFLRRVLAEEGISFVFDQTGDTETMVLVDDNAQFKPLVLDPDEGEGDGPLLVPVSTVAGRLGARACVTRFSVRHKVHTAQFVGEAWDWKASQPMLLQGETKHDPAHPWHHGEAYVHDARRVIEEDRGAGAHRDEVQTQVDRTSRGLPLEAELCTGSGTVAPMTPGGTFELEGSPRIEDEATYYVLRVRHMADCPEVDRFGAAESPAANYQNEFTCLRLDVPYRPTLFAKPRIYGLQTATVVGPDGEEIYTDPHGRIKVRMHFDREQREQVSDTSCWLRVVQMWAGPHWGSLFIPRVGMEVVVNFLDGDPDRPLCMGSVYNAGNPPPYALPDEKTKSVIKSSSSPGGDGYNEFTFEDAAGAEQIILHAQKDFNETVENDHNTTVHHNQTIGVDGDQSTSVGGNQSNTVTKNQTETVKGNVTITVEGERAHTITQKETVTLQNALSLTVGKTEYHQVTEKLTEAFDAGRETTVKAGDTETVETGDKAVTVAAGSLTASASTKVAIKQTESHTFVLENRADLSTSTDFKITNGKVTVESTGGVLKLTGTDEISLACGAASITLKSDGSIDIQGAKKAAMGTPGTSFTAEPSGATVSGAKVSATAIGIHEIKGALVKIN